MTLVEVVQQGAVLAAIIGAIGWFVSHQHQKSRANEERRAKAELEFLERQIEELYGPLASLLHEGRRSFSDLCISLGRNHIFPANGCLPANELKTWLYWAEAEFLPRNDRIKNLLIAKAHLIHGSEFPKSYIDFLDHANSWAINHRRWKDENVEYSWRSRIDWPPGFEREVLQAFGELKRRHNVLLGRISAH
jgi:hypothetical protein